MLFLAFIQFFLSYHSTSDSCKTIHELELSRRSLFPHLDGIQYDLVDGLKAVVWHPKMENFVQWEIFVIFLP